METGKKVEDLHCTSHMQCILDYKIVYSQIGFNIYNLSTMYCVVLYVALLSGNQNDACKQVAFNVDPVICI